MPVRKTFLYFTLLALAFATQAAAQKRIPPADLWTDDVLTAIKDKTTLDHSLDSQFGYSEIVFTSNAAAKYTDAKEPYAEHTDEKIKIHGYLVYPTNPGPLPAIVLMHGRGGKADLSLAQSLSSIGMVVFAIDGPQAGRSIGGPTDVIQSWITVEPGADYSYLYHYAYAGMRALTLLEKLAEIDGNPHKIDATKLGVMGISSGGIAASVMNGVDSRIKAAAMIASAGNLQRSLRYPNSWLYHDIYTGTRDQPYNSSDPKNSIEDVDFDATLISFLNHFDPVRYAIKQYGPVLTLIGSHDQYAPLPSANLTHLATTTAGAVSTFEKRLWLVQNATYPNISANVIGLTGGLRQWFDFCFGKRAKPLLTPTINMTDTGDGLKFDILTGETTARLDKATIQFFAATKVDATASSLQDFTAYSPVKTGTNFVATLPAGEKSAAGEIYSASNIIYFATITDSLGMPVSTLAYKGRLPIDLSTDFVPVLDHNPASQTVVPVPPAAPETSRTAASSVPVPADTSYQGSALSNPTDTPIAIRVEARTPEGRIAAVDGMANPVLMTIPARSEQIFLAEEWLGRGARNFSGSFQVAWNGKLGTSLGFRGNTYPAQLDAIGPLTAAGKSLWLPFVPEQDGSYSRKLKMVSASSSSSTVTITYRDRLGVQIDNKGVVIVPAYGSLELDVAVGSTQIAIVQIDATNPIYARIEVKPSRDSWSIEALPAPTATHFVQPHCEFNGTYKTLLVLANTNSDPNTKKQVIFKRHKTTGEVIGNPITLTLEKSQTASLTVETLFQIKSGEPTSAGWVEADVAGGQVIMHAIAVDSSHGAAGSSAIGAGETGSLSMPFYVENDGYWTGLAIANPGSARVTVDITAYSDKGDVLGKANGIILEPYNSKTQTVHQWLPDMVLPSTGQIMITASGTVNLLAYFGTNDGGALAAIPFTPVVP